jgi:hypothetical protein
MQARPTGGWPLWNAKARSPGSLSTPGYLEIYQLGGTASLYTDQVESEELREARQDVEDERLALRARSMPRARWPASLWWALGQRPTYTRRAASSSTGTTADLDRSANCAERQIGTK